MTSNLPSYNIVERDVGTSAREIDASIKNKWVWAWLVETDGNGDFFSDYIKKIDTPGAAICVWCKKQINYGSSGKKALAQHYTHNKDDHLRNKHLYQQNTRLPSLWIDPNQEAQASDICEKACDLPYGVANNVHDSETCISRREPAVRSITSILDRKHHIEAFVLSFPIENSLPLSKVPKLIELAKCLSKDPKALNQIKMDRTCATYKLKHGLTVDQHNKFVQKLRSNSFSINMDECTSTSHKKVFSILVSFFDPDKGHCVVEHYDSLECILVNAESLFSEIVKLFERDAIPWKNLVSDLSDSTNYMRGKISGLETKLREVAPHLLDIDGDLCHHIHNSVKKFCVQFENFLERFLDDLHSDSKWSPDIRQDIAEICLILMINYKVPAQWISHRWLSAYDCTLSMVSLVDAYYLFYYSWVKADMREVYDDVVQKIFEHYDLTDVAIERIRAINKVFAKKKLTDDGVARKERIIEKLIFKNQEFHLHVNCYLATLPLFKSLVLILEQKEPLIHRMH